jgi:hypothetical protein
MKNSLGLGTIMGLALNGSCKPSLTKMAYASCVSTNLLRFVVSVLTTITSVTKFAASSVKSAMLPLRGLKLSLDGVNAPLLIFGKTGAFNE